MILSDYDVILFEIYMLFCMSWNNISENRKVNEVLTTYRPENV